MKITDQQVQLIIDAYEYANNTLKDMYSAIYEGKAPTNQTLLSFQYQEGNRNALRDVVDELGLL